MTQRIFGVGPLATIIVSCLVAVGAQAQESAISAYKINPGDLLSVTVWKEEDLQRQVLVRPDGAFSFPLAGEIQASFLPRQVPEIPGWLLSATLQPAREASGDYYDFVSLPNRRWGIAVADVSDKGAGAALYMALSCTLLRTYAQEYPGQPARVLEAVNRRLLQDCSANQFVTVFYGILDPGTGTLVYCNAGHCAPLHFRAQEDQAVHELTRSGMLLGIFEEWIGEQETVRLDPGDLLVLYTDGITEAHYEPRLLYGEERLQESVLTALGRAGLPRSAPQAIQEAILGDVHRFLGGAPQSDDIALILLQRCPERPRTLPHGRP